ncbi:TolC family protein [Caloranaerobacter ferrireducens]|uniref:TolC family protein n=1 Tax=Caloranaerobacter ferrireducens TaxID=1323370 RepID=UPI00084D4A5B|nr:TolC family protein [Caloranaerobacter ferrireducens]
MKKVHSKVFTLFLLISIIMLNINYSVAVQSLATDKLNMDEAIKLALQNSFSLEEKDIDIENARIELKEKRDLTDEVRHLPAAYKRLGFENYKIWHKYYEEYFEYLLKLSKKNKVLEVSNIKYNVMSNYYNILYLNRSVEILKDNINQIENQLKIVNARLETGNATELEKLQTEISLKDAKLQLKELENNQKIAIMTLNKLLGLPLEQPLELEDELSYEELKEIDLEEAIQNSLNNRLEMYIASQEKYFAQKEYNLGEKFYVSSRGDDRREEEKLYHKLQKAENQLKETELNIRINMTSEYLNLLNLVEKIKVKKENVELAKDNLNQASLKYEIGMGTNLEVLNSSTLYKQALLDYYKAIYDFNLAKFRFEALQNLGIRQMISAQ